MNASGDDEDISEPEVPEVGFFFVVLLMAEIRLTSWAW